MAPRWAAVEQGDLIERSLSTIQHSTELCTSGFELAVVEGIMNPTYSYHKMVTLKSATTKGEAWTILTSLRRPKPTAFSVNIDPPRCVIFTT